MTDEDRGFQMGLASQSPLFNPSGSDSWNWSAIVVYTHCVNGCQRVAVTEESNELNYRWIGGGPWGHWSRPSAP